MNTQPQPDATPVTPEEKRYIRAGGDIRYVRAEDNRDGSEYFGDARDPFVWRDTIYMVDKYAKDQPSPFAMNFMWVMYRNRPKNPGEHDPAPKRRDNDVIDEDDLIRVMNEVEADRNALLAYKQFLIDTGPRPVEPAAELIQEQPTTDEPIQLGSFVGEAAVVAKDIFHHLSEVEKMRREHPAYQDDSTSNSAR